MNEKLQQIRQKGYDVLTHNGCKNIKESSYGLSINFTFEYKGKKYKARYLEDFYGSEIRKWVVTMIDRDTTYFAEPFAISYRRELERELNRVKEGQGNV